MRKPRQLVQVEILCQPTIDVSVTSDPLTNIDIDAEIVPGVKGATFIPSVSSEGIISWTNDGGLPNPDPVDITGPQGELGPVGPEGPEGFSPSASVSKNSSIISIVITDKEGTTSVQFDNYEIPTGGIPKSDLALDVQSSLDSADSAYQKPITGIPSSDLSTAVQSDLLLAESAYQKPEQGIPKSDFTAAVQSSLDKADTALQETDFDIIDCGTSTEVIG